MAAWRCPACGVNYPSINQFNRKCPRCSSILTFYTGLPEDPDWRDNVPPDMLPTAPSPNTPTHPENLDSIALIHRDNSGTVHVPASVLRPHYPHAEAGDVVRIGGKHYELEGYDSVKQEWWLSRMEFDADMEAIASLPDTWERHEVFSAEDEGVEGWALYEYPPPEGDG